MANNNPSPDERKAAIIASGVMVSLQPALPATLKVALSAKQNYALAAEEIFCHALNRTVWMYRNDYEAVELIMKEVKNTALESVATEQGIERITGLVFGDSVVREFIFTLQAQFFSQFAEFNTSWAEMIGFIATSLTNDAVSPDASSEFSLIPEDIRLRMYSAERMRNILLANNWLVMFIFTVLWGRTTTYDELRALQRRALSAGN